MADLSTLDAILAEAGAEGLTVAFVQQDENLWSATVWEAEGSGAPETAYGPTPEAALHAALVVWRGRG